MTKMLFALGAAMAVSAATGAQAANVLNPGTGAPYALTTTTYTQDFNSLKSTSLDPTPANTLPAGWQTLESGDVANGTYHFGSSGSATMGVWSFGNGSERALGGAVATSMPVLYVGAIFENALGGTIDSLNIGYTGEQWQDGYNRAKLTFQYSLDATSIDNGTWTSFSPLDFQAPNTAAHVGSEFGITGTNGNLAGFRSQLNGTIGGLSIGSGDRFGLRWALADTNDFPATDIRRIRSDDGLAIDDFRLTASVAAPAVPEPATWMMMIAGFGTVGAAMRRRTRAMRFA